MAIGQFPPYFGRGRFPYAPIPSAAAFRIGEDIVLDRRLTEGDFEADQAADGVEFEDVGAERVRCNLVVDENIVYDI